MSHTPSNNFLRHYSRIVSGRIKIEKLWAPTQSWRAEGWDWMGWEPIPTQPPPATPATCSAVWCHFRIHPRLDRLPFTFIFEQLRCSVLGCSAAALVVLDYIFGSSRTVSFAILIACRGSLIESQIKTGWKDSGVSRIALFFMGKWGSKLHFTRL